MTIGERIKELRKQVNLTQQAFADRLNLKRNTVGSYEVNVVEPSDRTISDICREFDVNKTWLLTGEGEMFEQRAQSDKITDFLTAITKTEGDDFKRRFVEMLSELEPDDWKLLERMAEKLQKKEGNP